MRRNRTRNERKRQKFLTGLLLLLALFLWAWLLVYCMMVPVRSAEEHARQIAAAQLPAEPVPEPTVNTEDLILEITLATADVDKPAAEPIPYEDHFRDAAHMVEDCTITYYCAEKRPHICGTGDGITATGTPVTPYWTCAVDPSVIPYGATVMVDWGDSVAFYEAQDCGSAVDGSHIDLAVATHEEALQLGRKTATVYWLMEEGTH